MSTAETKPREVCIMQLQPAIDWSLVWGNLHNVILSYGVRSAWYLVIHGTIPTNMRLHRIRLKGTEKCTQCGRRDTVLHRLTECGLRQEIWEWIRTRIAGIQRTDPKRIPNEWLLRLCVKLWPWHRQQATLWFLVSMVFFMWCWYWTALTSTVGSGGRYIRTKKGCNWRLTIWRCSKQAWNTGTLYDRDEQQTRGTVTCTYYAGLQNPCSQTSF